MESENEALRRQLLEMQQQATQSKPKKQTSSNELQVEQVVISSEVPHVNLVAELLRACEQTTLQQEKITQSMR
jgi:hypothetical protein